MSLQQIVGWIASSAAGERAGWVIVHSLWQFAAVAILAAVALRALTSASALLRYRVLTGTLLVMAALPVATWLSLPAPTPATLPAAGDAVTPMTPQASTPDSNLTRGSAPAAVAFVRVPAPTEPAQEVVTVRSLALALAARIRPWMGWIVAAWALGVVFFALRPLVGWLAWRRLTRIGVAPVPDFVEAIAARAAMQLRVARPVAVLASSITRVPAVAGWFRPVILMPAALLTTLPVAELEAIIVHELVHVRRGDFLVNVLQMAIEALGFYHPAVWWLSRKIRETRELACDDLVLAAGESPLAYGRALVAVEELRSRAPAFALGASGGSLVARIRRITRLDPEPARASAWPLSALVAAGCVAATLLMLPGGPLAPSRAVAADAAADLPDLLTVKELTEAQAWAIVEAQAQKPALEGKIWIEQVAALAAKGADVPNDLADVGKRVLRLERRWGVAPHPLDPSLYPQGVPASIQQAANQFREYLFLPALETMSPEVAAALADYKGQLNLPGLTEFSPEAASMFAGYTGFFGTHLDISGLKTFPIETARIVAGIGSDGFALPAVPMDEEMVEVIGSIGHVAGGIAFPRMETLTPQVATLIVANKARLAAVKSLPADAAKVLAESDGGVLDLSGLSELTPEAAAALAPYRGRLFLSGLRNLPPTVAAELGKLTGPQLNLPTDRNRMPVETLWLASTDIWIDLSGLAELSPESARALAPYTGTIDLSGLRELSPELAAELAKFTSRHLLLPGVRNLTPEAAVALAKHGGDSITLSGLAKLSPESARAISTYPGVVGLSGLRDLTPDVAKACEGGVARMYLPRVEQLSAAVADSLAKVAGGLDLAGLKTLTPEVATKLAAFRGRDLWLNGVAELSPDVAAALAERVGPLWLAGVTTLTPNVARALAKHAGELHLEGVSAISPQVAALLATHEGLLSLGLEELSPGVAQALASHVGELRLVGLQAIQADAARPLAAHVGSIVVPGLSAASPEVRELLKLGADEVPSPPPVDAVRMLTVEQAEEFVKTPYNRRNANIIELSPEAAAVLAAGIAPSEPLSLANVETMSPEAAAALATFQGGHVVLGLKELSPEVAAEIAKGSLGLELNNLTAMSPEAARALGGFSGGLSLPAFKTLPPSVAALLVKGSGAITLDGLETLSPEAAAALATGREGMELRLGGLRSLTPAAAAALASLKGPLSLGLTSLSPDVAAALAPCAGVLGLDSVKRLSPEAAAAIGRRKGDLVLGLRTMSPEVARGLSQFQGQLYLDGVTVLSAEAARELAPCKGVVCLRGLGAITPEVAEALVPCGFALDLSGLQSLSPGVARALVKRTQPVTLHGVTELSPEVAEIIVPGQAEFMPLFDLHNVQTLGPGTIKALVKAHPGQVGLAGVERSVTTLTPDLAKLFANGFNGQHAALRLEGVTTLAGAGAADIAKTLATAKGQLALPALTRISQPALEALRTKQGVELPDEKSLEVVP